METRLATPKDLGDIQALNHKLFELEYANFDPYLKVGWSLGEDGKKYFSDAIENRRAIVAVEGGKTIGYLAGSFKLDEPYTKGIIAELENMFVAEAYRGDGVGKTLVEEFIKLCREKNVDDIRVTASAKNIGAISFYERAGFAHHNIVLNLKTGGKK
jgi:ribosomal protein S18 acetylase RimI-like enzyme